MLTRLLLFVLLPALVHAATNAPIQALKLTRSYGPAAQIFDVSVNTANLTNGVGRFLQATVDSCRRAAEERGKSPQSIGSMGGSWLEFAVLIALKEQGLVPAYWQAEFAKVPKNFNDVMIWSKEHGPVIISCKTSLRERYKQADLEAVALQRFYPNAKFFLVTLDDDRQHVARIRQKIREKELLALQALYAADNADDLFAFLKTVTLIEAPQKSLRSGMVVR